MKKETYMELCKISRCWYRLADKENYLFYKNWVFDNYRFWGFINEPWYKKINAE